MSLTWKMNIDFERLQRAAKVGGDTGVAMAAEHVRGVADELTPVESGYLVGSGTPTASQPVSLEHTGDNVRAAIIFKGPYARRQHEELDWHHEHGQAKYLEQPIATERQTVLDIEAEQIRRAL